MIVRQHERGVLAGVNRPGPGGLPARFARGRGADAQRNVPQFREDGLDDGAVVVPEGVAVGEEAVIEVRRQDPRLQRADFGQGRLIEQDEPVPLPPAEPVP